MECIVICEYSWDEVRGWRVEVGDEAESCAREDAGLDWAGLTRLD